MEADVAFMLDLERRDQILTTAYEMVGRIAVGKGISFGSGSFVRTAVAPHCAKDITFEIRADEVVLSYTETETIALVAAILGEEFDDVLI